VEQRFAFYAAKFDSRRPIHDFFGIEEAAQEQQGQEKEACGNVGQVFVAKTRQSGKQSIKNFHHLNFRSVFSHYLIEMRFYLTIFYKFSCLRS